MGNTASQEAARATTRKLSKPRVAGRDSRRERVATSAPANELVIQRTKATQFSNSYLVGPAPRGSISQRTSADVASTGPATVVFPDDPLRAACQSPAINPKSPSQPSFNELLCTERVDRRQSTGQGSINGNAHPSSTPPKQGYSTTPVDGRTLSAQITAADTRDAHSMIEEPIPRSQSLVERRASLHSRSNSRGGESQDAVCNLRRNSVTSQSETAPPHRTQSDTSLYPPHRRRSLILTPGVATRSGSPKMLRRKASFRRSMEPTLSVSRENSIDSKTSRHMSLPVMPTTSGLGDRAPTPSEAEYKQLGVMRFGTLRITNGAPAPSPGQEQDEAALYASKMVGLDDMGATQERPHHGFALQSRGEGVQTKKEATNPHLDLEPISPTSPKTIRCAISGWDEPSQALPRSPRSFAHRASKTQGQLHVSVRPPTSDLQTTSKHAAIDDQLFEEEGSPRSESTEPVEQVIETALELEVGLRSSARPSLVHVSRNDSGYVSNSSKSSQKIVSAVDSGYSSTASIRSVRQKSATADGTDYVSLASHSSGSNGSSPLCEATSNEVSLSRTEALPTPPGELLQPSASSKDDASLSTPRTSISSAGHSIIRLPSFRSNTPREQKQQRRKSPSQDRPKSAGNLLQSFSSPSRISSPPSNLSRMSSLRRLLSSGSRKSLATSYAVHEFDSEVPSVPSAIEEKLQGHNAKFPTAPKRLALRAEPSHDSLGTILSMDDTSESEVVENAASPNPPQLAAPDVQTQEHSSESMKPERRRSARLSISSVSGSISGAATSILSPRSSSSPRNVIKRRSTMDEKQTRRSTLNSHTGSDSDDDVIVDSHLIDESNFMIPSGRRGVRNSPYDQTFVGIRDQGRYPVPENQSWMKEPYVDPRVSRRQPPLRNRKSAPDVRQTMAGHLSPVFERDSVTATARTPPPVSIHTRGSKKRRSASKANRRQSNSTGVYEHRHTLPHDPYDSASSVNSSAEDLGHDPYAAPPIPAPSGPWSRTASFAQQGPYPPQQWTGPPAMRRPLFGQRYSYDGYKLPAIQHQGSALAPMPSREQNKDHWLPNRHREQASNGYQPKTNQARPNGTPEEQNPPFRVLHSYNSPAYKGIPIWG